MAQKRGRKENRGKFGSKQELTGRRWNGFQNIDSPLRHTLATTGAGHRWINNVESLRKNLAKKGTRIPWVDKETRTNKQNGLLMITILHQRNKGASYSAELMMMEAPWTWGERNGAWKLVCRKLKILQPDFRIQSSIQDAKKKQKKKKKIKVMIRAGATSWRWLEVRGNGRSSRECSKW